MIPSQFNKNTSASHLRFANKEKESRHHIDIRIRYQTFGFLVRSHNNNSNNDDSDNNNS